MHKHAIALILALSVHAAPIHAAHWPKFRRPNRDGKSPETGLLKTWPPRGNQHRTLLDAEIAELANAGG